MAESLEELDRRVETLRDAVRRAMLSGDRARASELRGRLRVAEEAWHEAADREEAAPPEPAAPEPAGPAEAPAGMPPGFQPGGPLLLPLREQVHQALTLVTVPAAPRLISAVHEALFAGAIPAARLTSLRRDEERSYRSAPRARPYYLCAALSADLLAPARGLLAVSTWPLERRVIGPLSPRVDYLVAAIQISQAVQRMPGPSPAALRLLWRFAANIPGAGGAGPADADRVAEAARAELAVHADADADARRAGAARARAQLDEVQQLFGSKLRPAGAAAG